MIPLRKSTSVVLPLGRFVDNVDGDTSETALSILNTDILLRKSGATSMVAKNSGGATHISVGEYHATFNATDTDTVGPLKIVVKVAGALGVEVNCYVFEQSVFDRYFGVGATAAIRSGTAQAGAAGTITLDAGASTVDDFYNDTVVEITAGVGAGQVRRLSDYVGGTKVASVSPNWITAPDNTSVFAILAQVEPSAGGGGGTDWTADERTALRTILGIPSSGTTPEAPTAGALKVIDDYIDTEIATILGAVDAEIAAIIADLAAIRSKTDLMAFTSGNLHSRLVTAANDAISALSLAGDAGNKIADFVLRRSAASAAAASHTGLDALGFRSVLGAVRKLVNRLKLNTTTNRLEMYEETDNTVIAEQAVTQTGGTNPVTEVNTI